MTKVHALDWEDLSTNMSNMYYRVHTCVDGLVMYNASIESQLFFFCLCKEKEQL